MMNKQIVLLYCFFSLISSVVEAQVPTPSNPNNVQLEKIDLETLKQYAINHNFEVTSLRRSVEEARARYNRAQSPFFPKLGLFAGLESQLTARKTQTDSIGYLSVNYNLFSGFDDSRKKQIAELELERMQTVLQRAEFKIGLEIERAFHAFIFKKNAIALKSDLLKINETHKRMAKQKRSAGMAVASDVMEFELAEALIKSDIVLLEQELEESRTNMKRLLGDEVGSKIEPMGLLRHEHIVGTFADNLEKIETTSESIALATKDLSIATVKRHQWKSKWLPNIEVEGLTGYFPVSQSLDGAGASTRGTILLKWNFFDGFDTSYEKRESEYNYLKTEAALKQVILESVSQAEIAFNRVLAIQKRVDLEQQNESRAKTYYSSVMNEYRRGVKNSSDLKMAADGLFEAKLRQENFKFDFLVQRIELEKSIGSAIKTELIEENRSL